MKKWEKVSEFSFWVIGDGTSVSVWNDCWVHPNLRLHDLIDRVPTQFKNLKVCDLLDSQGGGTLI